HGPAEAGAPRRGGGGARRSGLRDAAPFRDRGQRRVESTVHAHDDVHGSDDEPEARSRPARAGRGHGRRPLVRRRAPAPRVTPPRCTGRGPVARRGRSHAPPRGADAARIVKPESPPPPIYAFGYRRPPLSGNTINGLGEEERSRARKV